MNENQNIEALLFETLNLATSQDPQQVKQAEASLAAWEKEPNFYSTILNFYFNTFEDRVRYMAILTLKNGIDKHWRPAQQQLVLLNFSPSHFLRITKLQIIF